MSKIPGIYPDCDVNPYNNICKEKDCPDPRTADVGLGVYRRKRITVTQEVGAITGWEGELWVFAAGRAPHRIGSIVDDAVYEVSWDHRYDYDEKIHFGILTNVGGVRRWLFSNECCISKDLNEVFFGSKIVYDTGGEPQPEDPIQIDSYVNDDLDFDTDHGPAEYVAEMRMGHNQPTGDFEIRLRPDGDVLGPVAHTTWVPGQPENFTLTYDPVTRDAVLNVAGQELVYNVPPGKNPSTISFRVANIDRPEHENTRAQLYNIVYNGTPLPDIDMDTGTSPPQTTLGKHVIDQNNLPFQGYSVSGTFAFSWGPGGTTPTHSRIALQIKLTSPDSNFFPLPCEWEVRSYDTPIEFDADFGRIDYLGEMRWGNQQLVGDQEINFQPGTSGFPLTTGQMNWGNGVNHSWIIRRDATDGRIYMAIDGSDRIDISDSIQVENPRSIFIFAVAQGMIGRKIDFSITNVNGRPVDVAVHAEVGQDGAAQWDGKSIIFPEIEGDDWTVSGFISMGWDISDPDAGGHVAGSGILAHVKFGSVRDDDFPNCGESEWRIRLNIEECCPEVCTQCYDNTVFCHEWHDEAEFTQRKATHPGLPLQVLTDAAGSVQPLRQIALTRSADALNQDGGLLYGSQKWIMVWDLELNRLIDFFPKSWLRYGAGAYFQQQTFRKEVNPDRTNRVPYYVEEFDLGLAFNGQGSYNMDHGDAGQQVTGWEVPARLIGLRRDRQQMAPKREGDNDTMTEAQLYAEFNAVSVDAYQDIAQNAVVAQRERFFQDRREFLHHSQKQRFHDQIQFLLRETVSRILRLMTDSNEWQKHLVGMFDPETPESFGNFAVVLLNQISNKILRTKNDKTVGIFEGTGLRNEEESSGDWMRYIYGEIRRLVEIERIDKKDVQATVLETLTSLSELDGENFLEALRTSLDFGAIKEQYDLASAGRIAPGGGVADPDTDEENRIRGLAR